MGESNVLLPKRLSLAAIHNAMNVQITIINNESYTIVTSSGTACVAAAIIMISDELCRYGSPMKH